VCAMAVETSFVSEERFDQESFRRWLERRPPSDVQHYELIDGRIVMSPPAGAWHGFVESRLNRLIGNHADARGLGRVFGASTGYELPSGETLEPDVSFISRERWAAGPRPDGQEFLRIVPSLVVEVVSPSTARRERTEKLEIYARNGVEEYWIVDPRRRELTLFRSTGNAFAGPVTLDAGPIPSQVLPELAARVEDLFVDLD
jgi:Uma2 family endonuclease